MELALDVTAWLLPLLYLAVLVRYWITFYRRSTGSGLNPWPALAIGLHVVYLVGLGLWLGHPPLRGLHNTLSLVALIAAVMYWGVELLSDERRTGVFVFAFVFLFQYSASMAAPGVAEEVANATGAGSRWLRLHIVPALMAYAGFTLAAVYGGLHLMMRKNLKSKYFGILYDRVPSLELLGQMTWYALLLGFACLTLAVLTGAVVLAFFRESIGASAVGTGMTAKIVVGIAAWLIYLTAVLGRIARGWSGARVARFATRGFGMLLILLGVTALVA